MLENTKKDVLVQRMYKTVQLIGSAENSAEEEIVKLAKRLYYDEISYSEFDTEMCGPMAIIDDLILARKSIFTELDEDEE